MTILLHSLQHELGAIAVLAIRGMDDNREDKPQGIDQQGPFAGLHFFASVIAMKPPFSVILSDCESTISAVGCCFLPAARRTCGAGRHDFLPGVVLLPHREKLVNRLVGRKIMRQHAPLAAGFDDIKHGIHHLPLVRCAGAATALRWRQERLHHLPLLVVRSLG